MREKINNQKLCSLHKQSLALSQYVVYSEGFLQN